MALSEGRVLQVDHLERLRLVCELMVAQNDVRKGASSKHLHELVVFQCGVAAPVAPLLSLWWIWLELLDRLHKTVGLFGGLGGLLSVFLGPACAGLSAFHACEGRVWISQNRMINKQANANYTSKNTCHKQVIIEYVNQRINQSTMYCGRE
jgi:hypothetical protein